MFFCEHIDTPIITPQESHFFCPLSGKQVAWERDHTFNPAAIVRDGKIYLFYRAEDDSGQGIGHHTSRIGLAISADGIHFDRQKTPILYPGADDQCANEWPGGCEDPRLVETEEGTYVMTYTQWNRKIALLAIATSPDLLHWKKRGYAFLEPLWSKSGSILCRQEGEKLVATKINGKYWMYWGDKQIYLATSDDLLSWEPCEGAVMTTRPDHFDSDLVEPGPPALLTADGILLLYNGKSASTGSYAAGHALFDPTNPARLLHRCQEPFLKPELPFEISGQYTDGTVFIEGLVLFQGRWLLYYGGADSVVGLCLWEPSGGKRGDDPRPAPNDQVDPNKEADHPKA